MIAEPVSGLVMVRVIGVIIERNVFFLSRVKGFYSKRVRSLIMDTGLAFQESRNCSYHEDFLNMKEVSVSSIR